MLKPKSVLSEKRGTRQPKGWCVPRLLNPNQSLDPEQISLDCWADCLPWVRRRSVLRRERARNKMPTRKWKM